MQQPACEGCSYIIWTPPLGGREGGRGGCEKCNLECARLKVTFNKLPPPIG